MSVLKEFLFLNIDLIIFVAACYFTLAGFSNQDAMQDQLDALVVKKGVEVDVDWNFETVVSSDQVIAFLLYPSGADIVLVDGRQAYVENRMQAVSLVDAGAFYQVRRETSEDGLTVNFEKVSGEEE